MVSGQIDHPGYRKLPGREGSIQPGEYVVYHFVAKSFLRCTPEGAVLSRTNEMGYVFETFADAKKYCDWKVGTSPKLGCTVCDGRRTIVDQFFSGPYLNKARLKNDPKRQMMLGFLLLLAGSVLIWIDASHRWMLIVGFLVGARLVIGGLVKIGLALMGSKTRETRAT